MSFFHPAGTGHLKSVCLSHNALGSTGFELVLKTLPLHGLTHLDLSVVCSGPADYPALEHLAKVLSQVRAQTHKPCSLSVDSPGTTHFMEYSALLSILQF